MKEMKFVIALIVATALFVTLSSALYTVKETEQVVITQFGKPVGSPISKPGLHVKMPFIQTVYAFERRFLEWEGDPNRSQPRTSGSSGSTRTRVGASPIRCCSSSVCATSGERSVCST